MSLCIHTAGTGTLASSFDSRAPSRYKAPLRTSLKSERGQFFRAFSATINTLAYKGPRPDGPGPVSLKVYSMAAYPAFLFVFLPRGRLSLPLLFYILFYIRLLHVPMSRVAQIRLMRRHLPAGYRILNAAPQRTRLRACSRGIAKALNPA